MAAVTRILILINLAVFALQALYGDSVVVTFALWPVGHYYLPELHATVGFQPWQLLTSAFLHANLTHVALNMFGLYMFGRDVERTLGSRRFLSLYLAAVLSAALVQLAVTSTNFSGTPYPTVGASGGVFGILLAFAVLYPRRTIILLIPPIPMPAWLFVVLYGLIELVSGIFGTSQGIAHFAHLGGMVGAYLTLRHWRRGNIAG